MLLARPQSTRRMQRETSRLRIAEQSDTQSFIDSGSNGYYFPATTITVCPSNNDAPDFYCPSSTENLSAMNQAGKWGQRHRQFQHRKCRNLVQCGSDFAYGDLGGTYSAGAFDWGLPFFFGRNVYTGIQSSRTPARLLGLLSRITFPGRPGLTSDSAASDAGWRCGRSLPPSCWKAVAW